MKNDEQIKKNIVDRMASDSRIDASDIEVKVNNGQVTLSGSVPTYVNKVTAGEVAWNVFGVVKIDNYLNIKFPSTLTVPTDEDIKQSVSQLLTWDSDINEQKISVSVNAGMVTLEGAAGSIREKRLAGEDAGRVSGIVDVINKIAVVPTEEISDEIVGERVMDRIEQSTPLYVDQINARVSDGVVTLSGKVPTYTTWKSIFDTTENTLGVKDVADNVSIVAV